MRAYTRIIGWNRRSESRGRNRSRPLSLRIQRDRTIVLQSLHLT